MHSVSRTTGVQTWNSACLHNAMSTPAGCLSETMFLCDFTFDLHLSQSHRCLLKVCSCLVPNYTQAKTQLRGLVAACNGLPLTGLTLRFLSHLVKHTSQHTHTPLRWWVYFSTLDGFDISLTPCQCYIQSPVSNLTHRMNGPLTFSDKFEVSPFESSCHAYCMQKFITPAEV